MIDIYIGFKCKFLIMFLFDGEYLNKWFLKIIDKEWFRIMMIYLICMILFVKF